MIRRTPRYALYICAKCVIAIDFDNGNPSRISTFLPEDEAAEAIADSGDGTQAPPSLPEFTQWLQERKNGRFEVIVDNVDEKNHTEILPTLRWGDRQALIKRKLQQQFRDCDFTAVNLRKDKVEGKTKIVALMMALLGEEHFMPWLQVLQSEEVRIDSLTSPTLLTERVAALIKPGGSGLLVSLNPAGLRQTVLIDGKIRFSRLATLAANDAVTIQDEIQRTLQYLLMSQRLSRDEIRSGDFEVWVVDSAGEDQLGVANTLVLDQSASITVHTINPEQMGMTTIDGMPGLSLWLQVPGRKGIRDYRNRRFRRFSRLAVARKILWIASGSVAIAGLAAALGVGWAIQTYLPDTSAQKRSYVVYESERQTLATSLDQFEVSADEMKSIVLGASTTRGRSVRTRQLLKLIGKSMPDDPGLQLERISWAPGSAGLIADGNAPDPIDNPEPVSARADSQLNVSTQLTLAGSVDHGWSKTFANQQVQLLADRLNVQCECQTISISLPYDPAPHIGIAQDYLGDATKNRSFQIVLNAPPATPIRRAPGKF